MRRRGAAFCCARACPHRATSRPSTAATRARVERPHREPFFCHHLLQTLDVLRIQRVLAAERRLERQAVGVGVLGMPRPERVVRHVAELEVGQLLGDLHLPDRPLALSGIPSPRGRADHRLLEVDRIVHLRDHHQQVAVADEVLGHHRVRTARNAVALQERLLHVRRGHLQHPVLPHAGGEPVPEMLGELRRMRTAVEPDRAVGVLEQPGDRVADEPSRDRIDDLAHVEVGAGPAHRVLRRMRPRLMLGHRLDRRVPRERLLPAGGVERKAGEVAQLRSRVDANQHFLFVRHRPRAGEVDHRRLRRLPLALRQTRARVSDAAASSAAVAASEWFACVSSSRDRHGAGVPLRAIGFALEVHARRVVVQQVARIADDRRDDQPVVAVGKRDAVPVLEQASCSRCRRRRSCAASLRSGSW